MSTTREATWEDFGAVVDLLDARSRDVFGSSEVKPEHVRQRWELPGAELGWVADDGGTLVGYASLDSTQEATVAAGDPAVGDALFAHAERRARERGFGHVAVTAVREDAALWAVVERNRLELARELYRMWRPLHGHLPAPSWPRDVTVRCYAAADAARVQALLDEAYGGWDRDYVARDHAEWLALMTEHDEFDPQLWLLVERGDELVACALHWKEHAGRGWVKDIVARESERGRGLGTAMLHHAFRLYSARGVTSVGLKVDATNPTGALQLYDRVGFVIDQRYAIWTKRL